jgi:hypothetical protein
VHGERRPAEAAAARRRLDAVLADQLVDEVGEALGQQSRNSSA